jgi:hypothetical protein
MIETKTITLTQKTTYKQDWRAYNLAQTTEKHRFLELLADLCRGVKETYVPGGRGRAPHTNKDCIFAMVFKVTPHSLAVAPSVTPRTPMSKGTRAR